MRWLHIVVLQTWASDLGVRRHDFTAERGYMRVAHDCQAFERVHLIEHVDPQERVESLRR